MNNLDLLIGRRIRHGRWIAGVSQSELASNIQANIEVLQDYEKGKEKVPASTLLKIAKILNVSAGFFFSNSAEDVEDPVVEFLELMTGSGKDRPLEHRLSRLLEQTDQK